MDYPSSEYTEYPGPENAIRQDGSADDTRKSQNGFDSEYDRLAATGNFGLQVSTFTPPNLSSAPETQESPPFTIESDMYFDPMVIDEFSEANLGPSPDVQPQMASLAIHQIPEPRQSNTQFTPHPQQSRHSNEIFAQQVTHNSFDSSSNQNYASNFDSSIEQSSAFIESASQSNADEDYRLGSDYNSMSNGNLAAFGASYGLHDLSPLTTVNSHTPSISSMHSTQPSFFSAQQYLSRNSIDVPASIHRTSFDHYTKSRVSIESSNSQEPQRRHNSFTTSISNYIPFMGQRNYSGPPSPSSQSPPFQNNQPKVQEEQQRQQQPSRLIRGIFKNREAEKMGKIAETALPEQIFASEFEEDEKKPKKPKRSLFNRFKSTQDEEAPITNGVNSTTGAQSLLPNGGDFVGDESFISSGTLDATSSNSSRQHSHNNTNNNNNNNNNNTHNNNNNIVTPNQTQEPDYAALFEGVGKRNLVNTLKSRPKYKDEASSIETALSKEEDLQGSSTSTIRRLGDNVFKQYDTNGSQSVPGNQLDESPMTEDDDMKIKTERGSFDLPSDLQTVPIVNRKNKTRGRKENKVADMSDSSKIFLCTYCSRRFKRQEHLKRHFRSLHTFEKPYECDKCHKKFSRSDNLNQHYKIHRQDEEVEVGLVKEEIKDSQTMRQLDEENY